MKEIRIKSFVADDEEILWEGASGGKFRYFNISQNIVMIIVGLFFTGFSIFWMSQARKIISMGGGENYFFLFGLPFFLIGLYIMFGRVLVGAIKLRNTVYAVTDKRIMVVYRGRLIAKDLADLRDVDIVMSNTSNRGWIFFNSRPSHHYSGVGTRTYTNDAMEFHDIEDADVVYKLILTTRDKAIT